MTTLGFLLVSTLHIPDLMTFCEHIDVHCSTAASLDWQNPLETSHVTISEAFIDCDETSCPKAQTFWNRPEEVLHAL